MFGGEGGVIEGPHWVLGRTIFLVQQRGGRCSQLFRRRAPLLRDQHELKHELRFPLGLPLKSKRVPPILALFSTVMGLKMKGQPFLHPFLLFSITFLLSYVNRRAFLRCHGTLWGTWREGTSSFRFELFEGWEAVTFSGNGHGRGSKLWKFLVDIKIGGADGCSSAPWDRHRL